MNVAPLPDTYSFTYEHRGGVWRCQKTKVGKREIEVYISPTGKSVRVYVDGKEV